MNDVIYEAKVNPNRKKQLPFGCAPIGLSILFSFAGCVTGHFLVGIFSWVVGAVMASINNKARAEQETEKADSVLHRVALMRKGVKIERLQETIESREIVWQLIPLARIIDIEVSAPYKVCISTDEETVVLDGVMDAEMFVDAVKKAVLQFRYADVPVNMQSEDETNRQNAMTHLLRTGAITQAQFDTANDPDRPLPPQPAVDADTFHALEYQLQTGMITREQFDAMAYCQQKPVPEPQNVPAANDVQDADEQNALAYQQRMQQFGAMMPPDDQESMQI